MRTASCRSVARMCRPPAPATPGSINSASPRLLRAVPA
jgi:hypothetical protein